jgi:Cu/Ag efflux pump CusA
VIGGLLVATFATLMFVPCVFALLHQKKHSVQGDTSTEEGVPA